jgi:3-deoxy-D-manno-octulosonic acid (KDO) 8-phosphate synthase
VFTCIAAIVVFAVVQDRVVVAGVGEYVSASRDAAAGRRAPVTIDATHAVQLPGANPRSNGASTGGRRGGVPILAKAAVAAGANGAFLEFHHDPEKALCDGPSCLPLSEAAELLATLKAVHAAVRRPG